MMAALPTVRKLRFEHVGKAKPNSGVKGGKTGSNKQTVVVDNPIVETDELDEFEDDVVVYWKVRAADTNTGGTWSTQTDWNFLVYVIEAPNAFSLLTPADESVHATTEVTLTWEEATDNDPNDVVTYDIFINDMEEPFVTGLETTTYILLETMDDSTYNWTVRAVDSFGETTMANETWSFSIFMPEPPEDFALLTPENNTHLLWQDPYEYEFGWEESADPDPGEEVTYTLTFTATIDGEPQTISYAGLTEESYTVNVPDSLGLEEWEHPVEVEWYVEAVSGDDVVECEARWTVFLDQPTVVYERQFDGIPTEYSIAGTYPNPFNPVMTAVVGLPERGNLTVRVYNLMGRQVAELADGKHREGYHRLQFDASRLSSGVYFIHATVPGKFSQMRKVVLMK